MGHLIRYPCFMSTSKETQKFPAAMTPIKIRGAIMFFTGMMPNDFAESKGIARSTLHRVINNKLQTEAVREVISGGVDIPVSEIWTEVEEEK